jgi:hypothetical protein
LPAFCEQAKYTLKEIDLLLSVRKTIFADDSVIAKKQNGKYEPNTLQKLVFGSVPK